MALREHQNAFDNGDLTILRIVHDEICAELKITSDEADRTKRERVAWAIFVVAQKGERDLSVLRRRALQRFNGGL